jgi:hypothetical protein
MTSEGGQTDMHPRRNSILVGFLPTTSREVIVKSFLWLQIISGLCGAGHLLLFEKMLPFRECDSAVERNCGPICCILATLFSPKLQTMLFFFKSCDAFL